MSLREEISRRRTFAIISHPDAGKTTLTEKFLLYGGAIAQAGAVKGKKNSRAAVSDWMEIEKQRGISVTSSVMQFQYGGCQPPGLQAASTAREARNGRILFFIRLKQTGPEAGRRARAGTSTADRPWRS